MVIIQIYVRSHNNYIITEYLNKLLKISTKNFNILKLYCNFAV